MTPNSGENLQTSYSIDEIITKIQTRFSNVMPGALQVPERVRGYVHEALGKTGTLSDKGVIDAFIESLLDPNNGIINTAMIAELIKNNSLTSEQIGRLLEHLKKVQEAAFLRVVEGLFNREERKKYGIQGSQPPRPYHWSPKKPEERKKPEPIRKEGVARNPVEKNLAGVQNLLKNPTATIKRATWHSYMRTIGLGNRPAKAGAINITPEDLAPVIEIIQLLLEKYPEWDAECIPSRIRNFISLLIEKNYFHESEGSIDMKEVLAQAFRQIPKDKKDTFIRNIFGSDANKMLKITQVERKRKIIYHGYTKTPLSHSILEVLFIAGILDENQKNIYVRAMRERLQELKEDDTNKNEEYRALEKFLRDEKQRNLPQR